MTIPPRLDAGPIVDALNEAGVDFVLIGGLAGTLQGSSYPTYDLDIAYSREPANFRRVVRALKSLDVTLNNAPPGLPFVLNEVTLANGANFTFDTRFGRFDILGHVPGVATYDDLRERSEAAKLEGREVRIASIDYLIAMKRAANRTKDKLMVEEYLVIADEQERARREARS
ncbi:MAG: hypothetical protein M3355_01905 [Actinomycetota bacterium]|nr:hypothetical protein [Actinomycetota bacterium]